MNFFGHAVLATQHSSAPRYVLGAMLPDLVSMAGVRIAQAHDEELAEGIALHHETDARFHAAPAFCELCHWAHEDLQAAGVSRATSRAVGHVGTELLLDGVLAERASATHARAAYTQALEHGARATMPELLSLRGDADAADLAHLLTRLRQAPVPDGYREPGFVLDRLQTILARRPRLAFQPSDLAPTALWLKKARQHLVASDTRWVDALGGPA